MTRLALSTALAAAILAAPLATSPAAARHGQVSIVVTPKGRDAELVREGLIIYSLFKSSKNRANVDQRGSGNGAAIAQHGTNNLAEVFQRGKGHSATITQTGHDNAFGVFQFGRHTNSSVTQTGNGQGGLVITGGW